MDTIYRVRTKIRDLLLEKFGIDNNPDGFLQFDKVNGISNIYLEHPWEIMNNLSLPSIGIWSKQSSHNESSNTKHYEILDDNGYITGIKSIGLKKDRIMISIIDETQTVLIKKFDELSPYISSIRSIELYNNEEDGFYEPADVMYQYDSWIRSKEYPFQIDMAIDVTYYIYGTEYYYNIEKIIADINSEQYEIEIPEQEENNIETISTITETDNGIRVEINKV